jgi:hypothetical protein
MFVNLHARASDAMRHRLMHFTSPRKTMEHDGTVIQELAGTTLYDNLKAKSATQAFRTAEDFCAKYSDCGALL